MLQVAPANSPIYPCIIMAYLSIQHIYDDSPNLTNRLTILHISPARRNPISAVCISTSSGLHLRGRHSNARSLITPDFRYFR